MHAPVASVLGRGARCRADGRGWHRGGARSRWRPRRSDARVTRNGHRARRSGSRSPSVGGRGDRTADGGPGVAVDPGERIGQGARHRRQRARGRCDGAIARAREHCRRPARRWTRRRGGRGPERAREVRRAKARARRLSAEASGPFASCRTLIRAFYAYKRSVYAPRSSRSGSTPFPKSAALEGKQGRAQRVARHLQRRPRRNVRVARP